MKRFAILLAVLIGFGSAAFSQEQDTSKVRIGKKQYTIIVDDDKEVRIITDDDDGFAVRERVHKKKKMRRMNGTWDGIELGVNNFVNADYEFDFLPEDNFMKLKVPNSYNLSLNFAEKSFGLIGNYFGLVTGLGLEYSRYMLENDVDIERVDGMMVGLPVDIDFDKNVLSSWYLNLPLMAEIQLPVTGEHNRIHIAGGVIGGMRLCSRQVQKYTIDGEKQKDKVKGDFNLRNFRYGFTARVGYGDFAFFANYYPQPLFEDGFGPDIYPVTVGIHIGGE